MIDAIIDDNAGELVACRAVFRCTECDGWPPMAAVEHGFFGRIPYVKMECSVGHKVLWGEPGKAYEGGPLGWRSKVAYLQWRQRTRAAYLLVRHCVTTRLVSALRSCFVRNRLVRVSRR
jgi:hypothetical protein